MSDWSSDVFFSDPRAAEAAAGEAGEEAPERGRHLLDVAHAIVAFLAEFGARGGIVNRVAQAAERVDQPALLRLRAAPPAAAGDSVDLLHRAVARLGDAAGEVAVALLDHRLDHLPHFGGPRPGDVERAGAARGADAVGVHADLLQRARDGRDHAEDADRDGARRGVGVDAVGVSADPVPAGRRHV